MSSILIPLSLFLLSLEALSASSASVGSRSVLRAVVVEKNGNQPDFAVDLNATNFDAVLRDTPATYAIVEFFAHWCPACRNYKPHYEKVARLFNGPEAVHPGIILMTRVDCASKINTELCDRFSVGHYPMLFWGAPPKFVSAGPKPKLDKNEILGIDDGRTADRLLNWINKQLGRHVTPFSYGLEDEKFENEHLQSNVSDPGQIVRAVYDVEEATSTAFDIISAHKMINSETRASLIKFLQLLVAHHPSRRCRKGSSEFLVNFDELYPSDMLADKKQETIIANGKGTLGNFQICGKEVPRGYWMFCRGSRNDTRGFSCGLWVLLHSLSVRVEDGESQMAFSASCEFIHSFFICEECRQHFHDMCSSVSSPFNKTRDFVLWLWSAHNKVNERLMKEETSLGTGDPKFPKVIWPSKQLCPSCYLSQSQERNGTSQIDWDRDEVFKFLSSYYGKMLVTVYNGKGLEDGGTDKAVADDLTVSTNALVVPVGAALAIAVASCAFGALACFWRSRQKNRKYFHQPHYFKNI
ncbi:hypothetical protein RHGRI_026799 [Rhododendron griersonianum]|uniref:Sulfhydryl oxidase n=1 Tax=Rhododendron griersonianum TaxID=479676 RepID=A0AAV6IU58_9ERIC|nr:hypothetical protein RHGRI_026799 [Rhododendron griersonianum]